MLLLFASILVGCSSNDLIDNDPDAVPTKGVSFTLTEPDFGEEVVMGGRKINSMPNPTDTTDLGDGVLGEVSVTRDRGALRVPALSRSAAHIATRATAPLSSGRYTVLAFDAAGTLKGQINATVASGKFANRDVMELDPGTYTFVCLNDKVDYSGGVISVSKANAATARIGRTVMTISEPIARVPFVMNHVGLRVRVGLEAMVNIPKLKAMIVDNSGKTPTVTKYDPITGTYTTIETGTLAETPDQFPATNQNFFQETYTSKTSTYHYLLPSESTSIQLKFTEGDKIYHKDLVGRTLTSYNGTTLEANGTYLLNVKLTKVFKYLFNDGSVDFLRNKGTRTPIALVISETDRSAIALNDANNGNPDIWTANRNVYNNPVSERPSRKAQISETSLGEHFTWDASGSLDGVTIKANEPTNCPAFYHAAHYNPGVAVTNLKRWYLGANTDWKNVYLYVGFGTNTRVNADSYIEAWYYHVVDKAFEEAGGTTLSVRGNENGKTYWSSTYYSDFDTGLAQVFKNNTTDGNHSIGTYDKVLIRAFIHY